MSTFRMFAAPVPLETPTVKVTGVPADDCVVGPVIEIPVFGRTVMTSAAAAVLRATLAFTEASRVVVRIVLAMPFSSVVAGLIEKLPWVVVKVTGKPERPKPFTSSTRALTVVVPPDGGSEFGLAVTT